MAEIEQVLLKRFVIKSQLDAERWRCRPLRNRVEEYGLVRIQACIVLAGCHVFDVRDVAVAAQVGVTRKVHWCWTGGIRLATAGSIRYGRLQF